MLVPITLPSAVLGSVAQDWLLAGWLAQSPWKYDIGPLRPCAVAIEVALLVFEVRVLARHVTEAVVQLWLSPRDAI
jgi:hypothetical protein